MVGHTSISFTTSGPRKRGLCKSAAKCPKLNQILAGVISLLLFVSIYAIFLKSTIRDLPPAPDGDKEKFQLLQSSQSDYEYIPQIGCEVTNGCHIKCVSIYKDIVYAIRDAMKDVNGTLCGHYIKSLTIETSSFPNQMLDENWIDSETQYIESLSIINCEINYIHPKAFKIPLFSQLNALTLEKLRLGVLESNSFQGMLSLTQLNIRESRIKVIKPTPFKELEKTLKVLQLQHIEANGWVPEDITGSTSFKSLLTIDFQFNDFGSRLTGNSFKGFPKCQQLFLTGSNITSLPSSIFRHTTELQAIYLDQNKLKTLPKDVFKPLFSKNNNFKLNLVDNLWNCNCDLMFLKNMQLKGYFMTNPICHVPKHLCGQSFENIPSFCERTTKKDTSSTSSVSSSHTTDEPFTEAMVGPMVSILCRDLSFSSLKRFSKRRKRNSLLVTQRFVRKQSITFSIESEMIGAVSVRFKRKPFPRDSLIWFRGTSNSDSEIPSSGDAVGCLTDLSKTNHIYNLTAGETYTLCMLSGYSYSVSPFNCRSINLAPPWSIQTWITNDKRTIIIALFTGVALSCCVLGAAFVYVLVRKKPSLLRGSKRIVMVKHRTADAIVMPSSFKTEEKNIIKNKSSTADRRPAFVRSVSELSIISSKSITASYVSAVQPTQDQLVYWRMERLREKWRENKTKSGMPPTIPTCPPLSARELKEI